MSSASRIVVVLVAAVLVGAAATGIARADGDPASDYLIVQPIYVPFGGAVPAPQAAQLQSVVKQAKAGGYPIRVAMIATKTDLGSVTSLWRKPQPYAQFLGQELFYYFKGPLLIVMPNGYGIYHYQHSVASERALLDKLPPPGPDGAAIAEAATNASAKLAEARGVKVTVPALEKPKKSSGTRDRITLIAIVVAGVVIGGGVAFLRRRRRQAGELVREGPAE